MYILSQHLIYINLYNLHLYLLNTFIMSCKVHRSTMRELALWKSSFIITIIITQYIPYILSILWLIMMIHEGGSPRLVHADG